LINQQDRVAQKGVANIEILLVLFFKMLASVYFQQKAYIEKNNEKKLK
jgi:hypothetical protein